MKVLNEHFLLTNNSLEIFYSAGVCLYIFKNSFSEFTDTNESVFLIMENILWQSQMKLSLLFNINTLKNKFTNNQNKLSSYPEQISLKGYFEKHMAKTAVYTRFTFKVLTLF